MFLSKIENNLNIKDKFSGDSYIIAEIPKLFQKIFDYYVSKLRIL